MKLLTFEYNKKECIGILNSDCEKVCPLSKLGIKYSTMNEFIEKITKEQLRNIDEAIKNNSYESISLSSIKKMAPIPHPKQDIICLGINYMEHAVESAKYKKEAFGGERPFAVYFSKRVNEALGDEGIIPCYENIVDSLDYEVELAVIIGKDAKNVSKENAFDYVFGYTILNDVSARNLQTRHKQWYFGKSFDGFTPMGPYIVTADEFKNPIDLKISSKVNGELRQNSSTSKLIFDIPHVINELSQGMTLKSGTIISMGTPSGVGMGFQPPKFLKKGDIIQCEIEKIGSLTNKIG